MSQEIFQPDNAYWDEWHRCSRCGQYLSKVGGLLVDWAAVCSGCATLSERTAAAADGHKQACQPKPRMYSLSLEQAAPRKNTNTSLSFQQYSNNSDHSDIADDLKYDSRPGHCHMTPNKPSLSFFTRAQEACRQEQLVNYTTPSEGGDVV